MKFFVGFFAALFASTCFLVAGMDVAEAKRLGGGQSFGGKFSQSQPLKKNAAQRQQGSPAQQKNTERKQQLAQKGGLMGMLGALAIGGLLGALFLGGAFEGVNFMDVLIFGLIIFMLYKFMARRAQTAAATEYGPAGTGNDEAYQQRQSSSDFGSGRPAGDERSVDDLRSAAPRQFDETAFLDGAKDCFRRLQRAWDEGDLADIRQFSSDHVFGEIQDQYHARGNHAQTEVVSLDAELLSATGLGSKQEAIVLFKAELKEDGEQHLVDEVWHFSNANPGQRSSWRLDGIQQVEG